MQVLLLDPDFWRFLGISQVLSSEGDITILGEPDYRRILGLQAAPSQLEPDVVIVSHSLTVDYGVSLLEYLQKLFPNAQLLVDGYDQAIDQVADVLRAGAKGYFLLSSEPSSLLKALSIVHKGYIWAPREALALLIAETPADSARHRAGKYAELITPRERSILKLLQEGYSNKDIASSLSVAEVTIKTHLTKLYRRFGVHTRLELLAYVINHRLLAEGLSRTSRMRTEREV